MVYREAAGLARKALVNKECRVQTSK